MKIMIVLFTIMVVLTSFLPAQEIIQNSRKPLGSNAGQILEVEQIFRITDTSEKFYFKWPSGLRIADDGCIFLTDESQFLKFSSAGKHLKNIYKKGQGPGEIQSPFFYYHLQEEKIFIFDPMNSKILLMDHDGNPLEEFKLKERYVQFIGLLKDNFIFTKYIYPEKKEQTGRFFDIAGRILLISSEGSIVDECPGIPFKTFLHQNLAARIPLLATQISEDRTVCFMSDPDEYMIFEFNLENFEIVRKFKREYSRVQQPERKAPLRPSIKIPVEKYKSDIVSLFNFRGDLWVETSTNELKKGTLFDVYNREGVYIDNFWLDVGGSLMTTHEDYIFVREQDEDGRIIIVKYRVLD